MSRRSTVVLLIVMSVIGALFPDRNLLLKSANAAVPAAPTSLSTRAGNGYLRISFTAPAGTITNYKYQLSTDGGATYADPVAFSPADTASPVQIGGLTNGTPYTVKLLAVNADGTGTASSAVTATPTALTAYVGSGSSRNAFLQGQYAEVGVRRNGAFGSDQVPPTGFHHNYGNCLGFRVDRSFDGWDQTSTDDGDFFCPGSPYEGWSIKVTDSGTAFNECDSNVGSGILGTFDNLTTADGSQSVRWTSDTNYTSSSRGTSGSAGVRVVQVSSVPDNSQVLHVDITLTNTTASSLSNIYYARSFDPDNYTASGVYTSTNTVIGQGTSSEVKSTWTNGSLIMMKSTDSRSRAARRDSGFGCSEAPKYIYDAPSNTTTNGWTSTTTSNTSDSGTGIAVKISSLGAGDSTTFRISYVLSDNESNIPGVPTINSITSGDGQLSVAFTGSANTPTSYDYSLDGGSTWTNTTDTVTPIVITGLVNGTTYSVKLRGKNGYGTGTASSAVDGTPATTAAAPLITSVASAAGGLDVSFEPGANGGAAITNYKYATSTDGTTWTTFTALSPADTSSPISITGLTASTSYYVKLLAVTSAGDGAQSNSMQGTTSDLPGAPTLTSVTAGDGKLEVNFTAGTNGGSAITNYKYAISTSSDLSGATYSALSPADSTSPIVITGLTNGTQYYIKLKAVNAAGDSSASNQLDGTPAVVPAAPTITAVTSGDTTLTVTWTNGSNGGSPITGYQFSTDGGATWSSTLSSSSVSSPHTITGLSNGATYYAQVRAVNSIGPGVASSELGGTPRGAPLAPTITSITAGDGYLDVAFTEGSNNGGAVTNFQYSTDGGSTFTALSPADNTSPIRISGLTNGTSYNVKIKAVNSVGAGTESSQESGTPLSVPLSPTISSVTPSNGTLTIAFTAGGTGGSSITNYQYSLDGGATWTTRSPAATTSPITVTGLTNGTTYQVQIRAVNSLGSGKSTESITASTPLEISSAPSITSVTGGNPTLSVAFTAGSGGTITNYEFSTNGGTTWQVRNPVSATSPLTISGLTNGTSYSVKIRGVTAAGSGVASDASSGTPYTTPSAPTITTVTDTASSGLSVAFTAGGDGGSAITNYEFSTNGGSTWATRAPAATTSPIVITGLTAGTSYNVKVRAVNAAGSGSASNTKEGTPTGSDTAAPVFQSAAVNAAGTQLTMTYDENLSSTTASTSAFTVLVNGSAITVSSVTISTNKVLLALGSTVQSGDSITVAYTDPSGANDSSAVQDSAGNDAASLSATSVTNGTTGTTTTTTSSTTSSTTVPSGGGGGTSQSGTTTTSSSTSTTTSSTTIVAGTTTTTTTIVIRRSTTTTVPRRNTTTTISGVSTTAPRVTTTVRPSSSTLPRSTTTLPRSFTTVPWKYTPGYVVITTTTVRISTTITPTSQATVTTLRPATTTTFTTPRVVTTVEIPTTIGSTTTLSAPTVSALAEPVYLNGQLPDPQVGEPLAVEKNSLAPIDVVTINQQVVQVDSPDGLRMSISVVKDDGELLPIEPSGKIIVERQQNVYVSGKGFTPETEVVVWLFSTPRRLGLVPVKSDGTFGGKVALDESIEVGDHTVQVNGLDQKGAVRSLNVDLEVRRPTNVMAPLVPADDQNGSGASNLWWYVVVAIVVVTGGFVVVARTRRRRETN